MALVMMAGLYILPMKLEYKNVMPLLSVRIALLMVIAINFATDKKVDLCMEHIHKVEAEILIGTIEFKFKK